MDELFSPQDFNRLVVSVMFVWVYVIRRICSQDFVRVSKVSILLTWPKQCCLHHVSLKFR